MKTAKERAAASQWLPSSPSPMKRVQSQKFLNVTELYRQTLKNHKTAMNTISWALWKCLRSCPLRKRQASGWKSRDSSLRQSASRKGFTKTKSFLVYCLLHVSVKELFEADFQKPVPVSLSADKPCNIFWLSFSKTAVSLVEVKEWIVCKLRSIVTTRLAEMPCCLLWVPFRQICNVSSSVICCNKKRDETIGLNSRRTIYSGSYEYSLVLYVAFPVFSRPIPTITEWVLY